MQTAQLNLPISTGQVLDLVRQLPRADKEKLLATLWQDVDNEPIETHLASESVLAKDWLTETEEKAWAHL
jgi:hypothetical protein